MQNEDTLSGVFSFKATFNLFIIRVMRRLLWLLVLLGNFVVVWWNFGVAK